jgi:hypothetical protein
MMEHIPCYSMKASLEFCGSQFYKEIGRKISRDEVMRSIFDGG